MRLEDIGFYTLEDERALLASRFTPLHRCELILTSSCNFDCPYCMPMREDCQGTLPFNQAVAVLEKWARHQLRNIRFSGGEPTLYRNLDHLVAYAKALGVEHVAVSTNGSADKKVYAKLLSAGVDDFSISLDACCNGTAETMSGKAADFRKICDNIEWLSQRAYTTVGVVFTKDNEKEATDITALADSLGVSDIRIIPAAQYGNTLQHVGDIPKSILDEHPILKYRIRRALEGEPVRGLRAKDTNRCPLVLDDMLIAGDYHFPCVIYFRQRGNPIGTVDRSIEEIREERQRWFEDTNTHLDPICKRTCLDVCVDYNNRWERFHNTHGVFAGNSPMPAVVQEQSSRSCPSEGRGCNAGSNACCDNAGDG